MFFKWGYLMIPSRKEGMKKPAQILSGLALQDRIGLFILSGV